LVGRRGAQSAAPQPEAAAVSGRSAFGWPLE